jgi:hypothetical protein
VAGALLFLASCQQLEKQERTPVAVLPSATPEEREAAIRLLQRANEVQEKLNNVCSLRPFNARTTMGDTTQVQLVLRNPFPEEMTFLNPDEGLLFEFVWEFTRWVSTGEKDIQSGRSTERHPKQIRIPALGLLEETLELPIVLPPDDSALVQVRWGLRIRGNGLILGEETLPMPSVALLSANWDAFPPGWEQFQANPMATLKKAVQLPQAEADRHVLVSAALLDELEAEGAIDFLCIALDKAPNRERLKTIEAALHYLTGISQPDRKAWKEWWRQRQNRNS